MPRHPRRRPAGDLPASIEPPAPGGASPSPAAAVPIHRRTGTASVFALEDAAGRFPGTRREAFPDATAEQWARADALDPQAADGQWWRLRFRCYAIRFYDRGTVLVDAGVGPADSPAADWAPVPGRLPEQLATAGIDPAQVDTVVLTHLHSDHIGWAVTGGEPFFPNARYVLQRIEHDHARGRARETVVAPLRSRGQLSLVDGAHRLRPELRVVHTPGHTPGHQSVLLEVGSETIALTGDVLVHMLQLAHPELPYALEADSVTASATRAGLLAELAGRGAVLATAHLSEPFIALPLG